MIKLSQSEVKKKIEMDRQAVQDKLDYEKRFKETVEKFNVSVLNREEAIRMTTSLPWSTFGKKIEHNWSSRDYGRSINHYLDLRGKNAIYKVLDEMLESTTRDKFTKEENQYFYESFDDAGVYETIAHSIKDVFINNGLVDMINKHRFADYLVHVMKNQGKWAARVVPAETSGWGWEGAFPSDNSFNASTEVPVKLLSILEPGTQWCSVKVDEVFCGIHFNHRVKLITDNDKIPGRTNIIKYIPGIETCVEILNHTIDPRLKEYNDLKESESNYTKRSELGNQKEEVYALGYDGEYELIIGEETLKDKIKELVDSDLYREVKKEVFKNMNKTALEVSADHKAERDRLFNEKQKQIEDQKRFVEEQNRITTSNNYILSEGEFWSRWHDSMRDSSASAAQALMDREAQDAEEREWARTHKPWEKYSDYR